MFHNNNLPGTFGFSFTPGGWSLPAGFAVERFAEVAWLVLFKRCIVLLITVFINYSDIMKKKHIWNSICYFHTGITWTILSPSTFALFNRSRSVSLFWFCGIRDTIVNTMETLIAIKTWITYKQKQLMIYTFEKTSEVL